MAKTKAKKEAETPEIIEPVEVAEVNSEPKPEKTAEDFVLRKLRVINRMENQAKAQRLASRLLRKRK